MYGDCCYPSAPCMTCRARHAEEISRAQDGVADPEVDEMTNAIVEVLNAPKRSRVEKAEALALIVMEAVRRERNHHEKESHPYAD